MVQSIHLFLLYVNSRNHECVVKKNCTGQNAFQINLVISVQNTHTNRSQLEKTIL